MADKEKKLQEEQEQQTVPEQETAPEQKPEEEAAQEQEAPEVNPEMEGLKAALEQAKADVESYKDKYLRQAAEFENYKRRTRKEKESLTDEVKANTVKGLLPILDNLEIAIRQSGEGGVKDGLVMLLRQCTDAMKALGVEEIESEGQVFDPQVHNAVMHIEDETYGESIIVEVLQKGYRMGERIVRHAMVKVAN